MTGTLYHLGYAGRRPADVADLLPVRALVADVRLRAWSGDPAWSVRLHGLVKAQGLGYRHEPRHGNLNYRTGGLVAIADIEAIRDVVDQLAQVRDVALGCACRKPEGCHRMVPLEALCEAMPGLVVAAL